MTYTMNKAAKLFLHTFTLLLQIAWGTANLSAKTSTVEQSASLLDDGRIICVIGDSGTGDNNALAVAHALESMNCSQIRILGDIIYPSGIESAEDPLLQRNLLGPYQYFIDRDIPIFIVLGNHDHKQNSEAWIEVAKQHPLLKFPNYYYAEDWGEICFFNLDSSFYEKIYFAHKRYAQTRWLRKALDTVKNSCKFSIATGHHPYRSSGGHGNASWQLSLFFEEELIGKIDMYLSGHDHHLSDEGTAGGTRLLISGAAGAHKYDLKEASEDKQFAISEYGFLIIQFSRDQQNDIVARYKFYSLIPDGKGGYTDLKEVWSGLKKGQGIRNN